MCSISCSDFYLSGTLPWSSPCTYLHASCKAAHKSITHLYGIHEYSIQMGDKSKEKNNIKCLSKVLGHHNLPEELQRSLAQILPVSRTLLEVWTPFIQKMLMMFMWYFHESVQNTPLLYIFSWFEIQCPWWTKLIQANHSVNTYALHAFVMFLLTFIPVHSLQSVSQLITSPDILEIHSCIQWKSNIKNSNSCCHTLFL